MSDWNGWDEVEGPATNEEIDRMRDQVRRCMADADVGPLILRIEELEQRMEQMLHSAFRAGMAYSTGGMREFRQTHPDRKTWVRKALGGES